MKIGASARNVAIAGFYCTRTVLVRAVVHHIKSTTMYEGSSVHVQYVYTYCYESTSVQSYKQICTFVLSKVRKYFRTFEGSALAS